MSTRPNWLAYVFGALIAAAFFNATVAVGFPENIRRDYSSCATCHVSGVAGGGAVTAYGRSAGAEFMSTWGGPNEAKPMFGLVDLPKWLAYGGDMRYMALNARADDGTTRHVKFWMQADAELAVTPFAGVTVVASAGRYGPDHDLEYRRSYVKADFGPHASLRAGRFMPYYGVPIADHTASIRSELGLGEGRETYAAEASVYGGAGEVAVTGVYGSKAEVDGSVDEGYSILREGRGGVVARAALYVGDRSQIGVSAMRLASSAEGMRRHAYGAHVMTGFTPRVYLLAEADRRFDDGAEPEDVAYGRLGWEAVRGLHLSLVGDAAGERAGGGAQAQWMPRPHLELMVQGMRTFVRDRWSDAAVMLFHYYL